MTQRSLAMAASALALLAGTGIAIIAVAFLGGGEARSERTVAVASPSPTLAPGTITPIAEPPAAKPPTPTTIGAGPKPTLAPFVPSATPTPEPEPAEPDGSGDGRAPSPSPAPTLPDLVVLDLSVVGNRVSAVIGNVGQQAVAPGTAVELALDSGQSGSSTLTQSLGPGGSFTLLLPQESVNAPQSVTARVDPRNLIPERNEANNSLTRQLAPDILLDLAVTGLAAVSGDEHLAVTVKNYSSVPARQVTVRLTVYRSDSSSPLSVTTNQVSIDPQGSTTLAPGLIAVRGLSLRVVLELVGVSDGNPGNNVLEALIP